MQFCTSQALALAVLLYLLSYPCLAWEYARSSRLMGNPVSTVATIFCTVKFLAKSTGSGRIQRRERMTWYAETITNTSIVSYCCSHACSGKRCVAGNVTSIFVDRRTRSTAQDLASRENGGRKKPQKHSPKTTARVYEVNSRLCASQTSTLSMFLLVF